MRSEFASDSTATDWAIAAIAAAGSADRVIHSALADADASHRARTAVGERHDPVLELQVAMAHPGARGL